MYIQWLPSRSAPDRKMIMKQLKCLDGVVMCFFFLSLLYSSSSYILILSVWWANTQSKQSSTLFAVTTSTSSSCVHVLWWFRIYLPASRWCCTESGYWQNVHIHADFSVPSLWSAIISCLVWVDCEGYMQWRKQQSFCYPVGNENT